MEKNVYFCKIEYYNSVEESQEEEYIILIGTDYIDIMSQIQEFYENDLISAYIYCSSYDFFQMSKEDWEKYKDNEIM